MTKETARHSLPSVCSPVGIRQEYPISAALAALVLRCTSQNGLVVDDVWTAMLMAEEILHGETKNIRGVTTGAALLERGGQLQLNIWWHKEQSNCLSW